MKLSAWLERRGIKSDSKDPIGPCWVIHFGISFVPIPNCPSWETVPLLPRKGAPTGSARWSRLGTQCGRGLSSSSSAGRPELPKMLPTERYRDDDDDAGAEEHQQQIQQQQNRRIRRNGSLGSGSRSASNRGMSGRSIRISSHGGCSRWWITMFLLLGVFQKGEWRF